MTRKDWPVTGVDNVIVPVFEMMGPAGTGHAQQFSRGALVWHVRSTTGSGTTTSSGPDQTRRMNCQVPDLDLRPYSYPLHRSHQPHYTPHSHSPSPSSYSQVGAKDDAAPKVQHASLPPSAHYPNPTSPTPQLQTSPKPDSSVQDNPQTSSASYTATTRPKVDTTSPQPAYPLSLLQSYYYCPANWTVPLKQRLYWTQMGGQCSSIGR